METRKDTTSSFSEEQPLVWAFQDVLRLKQVKRFNKNYFFLFLGTATSIR
jgi:hypothetical protein